MDLLTVDFSFQGRTIPFIFRAGSEGDEGVMKQIFQNGDYDVSNWPQGRRLAEYHREQSARRPSLIVDAGANIGAAAVFFHNLYDNAFVYAVEPEPNNFEVLELNTQSHPNKANFLGAIAQADGELVLEDPGLSDWGFRTRPAAAGDGAAPRVKSISPQTILADARVAGMTPLIFKIDIEGGEAGLFGGDTSWMKRFALVVVELHDWMLPFAGTSRSFLKAAARYDFDLVHKGENIFLFNREILAG